MTARVSGEYVCREIVEAVTDYLEDRLPPEDRALFEAHLAICKGCRNYLEQMRETLRIAGAAAPKSLRPEQRDELVRLFRSWKEKK
jgi:predicted anti-sigma-YlaC factor YlaD